ncbi:hypothetical protein Tco_0859552 [Tanacetum coccineum]|uniref:Retrotransposon gag domain-containing protein n=1 Tax=Tanacetum coccineum TaxID=301880 RepID=A0ABQ5BCB1_9ASTR
MPPRRSSAAVTTARAAATAAAAAPVTAAAVEQLIEARVETVRTPQSVFHIRNCAVENHVKFTSCTFLGNALTWWNSHMKAVTQDVAYGTDVTSYNQHFQELPLMYGRMFLEELDEFWKYVGGLPDMIRGNVMSYQPKTMEKVIKFANDQIDQKVLTIAKRQAEQKIKLEFNTGNNQGHQQQNKTQNTRRAYTAGPGEKTEYT